MKILVTGATGFIGNHVVRELLLRGHEVICASRKEVQGEFNGRVRNYFLDLDDLDDSEDYFAKLGKPDILIHLAWQGLPHYKALFHFENNVMTHYSFLKNMVVNGLKSLVVTGTCLEYGLQEGCLSEDKVPDPQNAYGIAKDTLRKYLAELQKSEGFLFKWIRLFYMYGQGQNENALFSQLNRALERGDAVFNMSGGEQERDYLPVQKAAEYIVKIAEQSKINGIINCCSGSPIKVRQLVEDYLASNFRKIKLNFGYYPYPDYEAMSFWGDASKLKLILDSSNPSNRN